MIDLTQLAGRVSRQKPFNAVVPAAELVRRRLGGRWWDEVEASGDRVEEEVIGRDDLQRLGDGVGDVLTRRYEISLSGARRPLGEALRLLRRDPDELGPSEYATFGGPLEEGDRRTVRLPGPWDGPVEVLESSPDRVRLATRPGHMEAGWIDFSIVGADSGAPRFRIESTARAGDAGFWFLHDVLPWARWIQTDMWATVAESVAEALEVPDIERVEVMTIRHAGGPGDGADGAHDAGAAPEVS